MMGGSVLYTGLFFGLLFYEKQPEKFRKKNLNYCSNPLLCETHEMIRHTQAIHRL